MCVRAPGCGSDDRLPSLSFQGSTTGTENAATQPLTQARSAEQLDPRAQGPAPRLRAQSRGGRSVLSGLKVTAAEHRTAGPCSLRPFSRLGRGTFCSSSQDPRGKRAEPPGALPQGPKQARARNRVFQLTMKS